MEKFYLKAAATIAGASGACIALMYALNFMWAEIMGDFLIDPAELSRLMQSLGLTICVVAVVPFLIAAAVQQWENILIDRRNGKKKGDSDNK